MPVDDPDADGVRTGDAAGRAIIALRDVIGGVAVYAATLTPTE